MDDDDFYVFLNEHPEVATYIKNNSRKAVSIAKTLMQTNSRVIFLDVDEVIAGQHAHPQGKSVSHYAVDLINALACECNAKIVYVSVWATHHRNNVSMHDVHEGFGFGPRTLHCDWRIDPSRIVDRQGRGDGVMEWLNAHPEVTDYVVIDDSWVCYEHLEDTYRRTIAVDGINGFTHRDYLAAKDILLTGQVSPAAHYAPRSPKGCFDGEVPERHTVHLNRVKNTAVAFLKAGDQRHFVLCCCLYRVMLDRKTIQIGKYWDEPGLDRIRFALNRTYNESRSALKKVYVDSQLSQTAKTARWFSYALFDNMPFHPLIIDNRVYGVNWRHEETLAYVNEHICPAVADLNKVRPSDIPDSEILFPEGIPLD